MSELVREGMPPLIIDRPDLQPRLQRTLFRMLTFLAWLGYLYLWLPLLTFVAWWLALRFGWRTLASAAGTSVIDYSIVALLLKMVLLSSVLLIGWAEYNRLRFQGRERRRPRAAVAPADTAAWFAVADEVARRLREARAATVTIGDHALVEAVDVGVDRRPPATVR